MRQHRGPLHLIHPLVLHLIAKIAGWVRLSRMGQLKEYTTYHDFTQAHLSCVSLPAPLKAPHAMTKSVKITTFYSLALKLEACLQRYLMNYPPHKDTHSMQQIATQTFQLSRYYPLRSLSPTISHN